MKPASTPENGPDLNVASTVQRIRGELDRLQESLSAREDRLALRRKELDALAAELAARQAVLAEREKQLNALADRVAREKRDVQRRLEELEKQEGFVARAADLERALAQREASLTQREQAMRRTLEEIREQGRALERQRRELSRQAGRTRAIPAAPPHRWRVVALGVTAVLAGGAAYELAPSRYAVQAAWVRMDGSAAEVESIRGHAAAAMTAAGSGLRPEALIWWLDGRSGRVLVQAESRDPAQTAADINAWGPIVARASSAAALTTTRAADELRELETRREALRRGLASAAPSRPSSSRAAAPSSNEVEAMWAKADALAKARRSVAERLGATRNELSRLARPADQERITIPQAVRDSACAADAEWTQARRRCKEQHEIIRAAVRDGFAAASRRLVECRQALDALAAAAASHAQEPPDAQAGEQLESIRMEAVALKGRVEAIGRRLAGDVDGLISAEDPVAAHRAIEPVIREFATDSAGAVAALERRVREIGEAGAQLTKRLVVRAALMKNVQAVLAAHRQAVASLESLTTGGNFRLDAAVQKALGAAETIRARAEVIEATLRAQQAEQARQERQRRIEELRREEQELAARLAEQTETVVAAQETMQQTIRRWAASLEQERQRQEAERRRHEILDELVAVEQRIGRLGEKAAAPGPGLRFEPAWYRPQPVNTATRAALSVACGLFVFAAGLLLTDARARGRIRRAIRGYVGASRGPIPSVEASRDEAPPGAPGWGP